MFQKLASEFNVEEGTGGENDGKFIFGIVFKTDEINYKNVRDELSRNPIIQHVAMYETEVEEIKQYLPQEIVSDLTRWPIE